MSGLDAAVTASVETRLAPRVALAVRLRAALDAFERAEHAATTLDVTHSILRQLGQQAFTGEAEARSTLLAASEELRGGLGAMLALLPAPVHASPSKRAATLDERDAADRLITEVDSIDVREQPKARLIILLRAIAAEVHVLIAPLDASDPTYVRLAAQIPVVGRLRRQASISEYIPGLSLGSSAQWSQLAREARSALARYDRDAPGAAVERRLTLVAGANK